MGAARPSKREPSHTDVRYGPGFQEQSVAGYRARGAPVFTRSARYPPASPEVKTIHRKLGELAAVGKAGELVMALVRQRDVLGALKINVPPHLPAQISVKPSRQGPNRRVSARQGSDPPARPLN
jgi:hypothetical protein